MMSDDFDTDAFIVLADSGIDPLTSAIASTKKPGPRVRPWLIMALTLAAVALFFYIRSLL